LQRYVTIYDIRVSQGRVVRWVRSGGKYLHSMQFQPLCHLPTKLITICGNLTKLWHKEKCSFLRHGI